MGLSFAKLWDRFFGKQEMRILMVGLDAAGPYHWPATAALFC